MFLLACILLTSSLIKTLEANTVTVSRKNGLSIGDLYKPPGGTKDCPRYGGVEYTALPGFCECKNTEGTLGTFRDRCDYNLIGSAGGYKTAFCFQWLPGHKTCPPITRLDPHSPSVS